MRTIIAGGRDFLPSALWLARVALALHKLGTTEVVSGTCRGADKFGEAVAEFLSLPIKQFPANWDTYGKSAGHLRNEEMADYAEALILLPGGPGTNSMREFAQTAKLRIIDLSDRD